MTYFDYSQPAEISGNITNFIMNINYTQGAYVLDNSIDILIYIAKAGTNVFVKKNCKCFSDS